MVVVYCLIFLIYTLSFPLSPGFAMPNTISTVSVDTQYGVKFNIGTYPTTLPGYSNNKMAFTTFNHLFDTLITHHSSLTKRGAIAKLKKLAQVPHFTLASLMAMDTGAGAWLTKVSGILTTWC
jgi:hypothetical protein